MSNLVSNAPFDGRTSNSEQFKRWALPEKKTQAAPRQWQPSPNKFSGITSNADQFRAYDLSDQYDNPVRVVIDHSSIKN